ncbi:Crp/Fnr family transcriptional regulator [Chthonobacter rhizosphaerae]|uniref:Crp/Fnr family transcriptional regulator n=1 Tax=Chthonobacter rhizosphaerae TaxID=2735553 RepID=UPI0015EFB1F5|nr:Crp/Fnr family transcriptional regulator [Chthonobacter rhizosphaerae]
MQQPIKLPHDGRPTVVGCAGRGPDAVDGTDLVLRRFARFVSLTASDRRYLTRLVEAAAVHPPRRTVLTEGRPCDCLHLLAGGWAVEYRTLPTGGRQVLRIRLAGEILGAECIAYGAALQSVQMLTKGVVARIPRAEFVALHTTHPQLVTGLHLMGLFERAILQEWTISLGRRPAWSRVAHLLLELDERCRVSGLARISGTPFPLTQQDLADCTGLTLTYVNRVLTDMRRKRMIGLRQQELVILNRDELARASGFQPRYLRPTPPLGPLSGQDAGAAPRPVASVL